MSHFGIISPPVPGHLNPFSALGRELIGRGHRVTVLHIADLEGRIRSEGLGFALIGERCHPKGSLPQILAALGKLQGNAALRYTIGAAARGTAMFLSDGPEAIRRHGIDALLVDQTEPSGAALADAAGIPYATVCNALPLDEEPSVPPPFSPFPYRDNWFTRSRNRVFYRVSAHFTRSIFRLVQEFRRQHGLTVYAHPSGSYSKRLQLSQLTAELDFPRRELAPAFEYVGPLRDEKAAAVPFPWERLDGRPLIYGSLGTLQGSKARVFESFSEACRLLPVQLVLSHGGGMTEEEVRRLPGEPLVVSYAPQTALLERASMTLTHAGLNTVLDSLSRAVPMVAVPVTFEQPAIAQRVVRCGAGRMLALARLTAEKLRREIEIVLQQKSYRDAARDLSNSIAAAGGTRRAADLIEQRILG